MTDIMSESYQWLIIGMIQTYFQSLVWFRYIISHCHDSDIISVIGMIQKVWIMPMTDTMSESYQWMIVCLNHTNDWYYVWIIPMTDDIHESYQWLILCLNHTNDWRHNISHWYDSEILSVIGMIQTYYQSLVWFRHNISHWYDSDILSVIGMIQIYHQSLLWFRHNINHCWIKPVTDSMSESYQWLILCLNHTNDWWYTWIIAMTNIMSES
jgi:hypothetical protein